MRPIERCLGEVAEVMAGMTGLGDVGNYRYGCLLYTSDAADD